MIATDANAKLESMPEPATTPPRPSPTHLEPTTPERVRQVELNRLRGIPVSRPPLFLVPCPLFLVSLPD
jgi:hypothetical protein